MSTKPAFVHPGIRLVAPRNWPDPDWEDLVPGPVRREAIAPASEGLEAQPNTPWFGLLPDEAWVAILRHLLNKPGQLIHCLSRLDPFQQPDEIPSKEALGEYRSGLPKRFFWGRRQCSITRDGADPQKLLAILGVNRRLYFLGVHVFYGLNTFAFSSLGEFGRFCTGIGLARLARIQHIELLWTGSQRLTCPPDERGKTPMSRRTFPLSWLCQMPCLRTLVVHVNETGSFHSRRNYESPAIKKLLHSKSLGQPKRRMARSLRCLQGLDYVWQLRGLDIIKFYDFNQVLKSRGHPDTRQLIADWSFTEGVQHIVTMEKTANRKQRDDLERVEESDDTHLLRRDIDQAWTPGPQDWRIVKPIFERGGSKSYDERQAERVKREEALAEYLQAGDGSESDLDSDSIGGDSGSSEGSTSATFDSEESGSSGQQQDVESLGSSVLDELFVSDGPASDDEILQIVGSDVDDSDLEDSDMESSSRDAVCAEDSDDANDEDHAGSSMPTSELFDGDINEALSESENDSLSDTPTSTSSLSTRQSTGSLANSNASPAALRRESSSSSSPKYDPSSRSSSMLVTPEPRLRSDPPALPSRPILNSLRHAPSQPTASRTGTKRESSSAPPVFSPSRFRGDSMFVTPGPARTPAPGQTPAPAHPMLFQARSSPSTPRASASTLNPALFSPAAPSPTQTTASPQAGNRPGRTAPPVSKTESLPRPSPTGPSSDRRLGSVWVVSSELGSRLGSVECSRAAASAEDAIGSDSDEEEGDVEMLDGDEYEESGDDAGGDEEESEDHDESEGDEDGDENQDDDEDIMDLDLDLDLTSDSDDVGGSDEEMEDDEGLSDDDADQDFSEEEVL
ncbi:hypothetical protein VTJ83DRAFT_5398 [Remersonia thermophila]|uniref:Uncharacterized protein n=1 Tax=Remersonia thermophila TaxID=72144 RepID=A0ABR4D865_9PEZI